MDRTPAVEVVSIVRSIPAPARYLCGLAWDSERFWHSDQEAGRIFGLDPADGAVLVEHVCAGVRADLTYDRGRLLQVGERPKRLLVIDPESGDIVDRQRVRPSNGRLCGVEAGPEGIWMCLRNPAVIQLRDRETMTIQREFPIVGGPSGLTYANGTLVYSEFEAGILHSYDAATGAGLRTVGIEGNATGMTWDGAHLWYCDFRGRRLCAVELEQVVGTA